MSTKGSDDTLDESIIKLKSILDDTEPNVENKEYVDNMNEKTLKGNLEYETSMTSEMKKEIDDVDEFLNFVFEHRRSRVSIIRSVQNMNTNNFQRIPQDSYALGCETGIVKKDPNTLNGVGGAYDVGDTFFKVDTEKVEWVHWTLSNADETNDNFTINISPFYFEFSINTSTYRAEVKVFTDVIFDKWNTKLEELSLETKKEKIEYSISNAYKILELDRKVKIEKLLKDE